MVTENVKSDSLEIILELTKGGSLGWKLIFMLAVDSDPETVVDNFTTGLAEGECNKAMKYTKGKARESVIAIMDTGCLKYETGVKSIQCEIDDDYAECWCNEVRNFEETAFNYELEKVNEKWRITNFEKDTPEGLEF